MSTKLQATASDRLARFLAKSSRRLRSRRALEASLRSLPYSLGAGALAVLALRIAASRELLTLDASHLPAAAAGLVLLLALGSAAAAASRRFGREELALLADHELGTRETLATAAWLSGSDDAERHASHALEALAGRGPELAIPLRRPRFAGILLSLAALALSLSLRIPGVDSRPAAPAPDEAVKAASAEVAEEIRKIAEELEDRDAPEAVRGLLEEIETQAEMMKQSPTSREEAALTLQSLEQAVQEERERREAADASALERALSSLEHSSLTRRAARAAQDGNERALQQELSSLAEAFREGVSFEEREIERLSVRLREAAEELRESSHQEFADRLDQLAEALESGDMAQAAELLEQLLESGLLEQAGNDAAANEALADAQALLQQALAQLGQARPDQLAADPAKEAAELLKTEAVALEAAGATELAEQLREIADALEANDLDRAEQLTEELLASGQCRDPTNSEEGDAAAKRAELVLAEVLAGLRQGLQPGAGGGAGDQTGRMAWSGRRTRSGSPIIDRDWGVGTTNEAGRNSRVGGPGNQSDRQSKETSAWVEAYEALHDSTRLADAKGRSTRVGGLVGEGEHVAVPVWTTSGGPSDPQRPLVKLPPSYEQASEDALAKETIPAGYRDSVRRYFESLSGTVRDEKGEIK